MTTSRLLAIALLACTLNVAAADGKAEYDRRNAERYATLFKSLDRNADGAVSRAEAQGDLNFSPRFSDIDIDGDGAVTAAELQRYVEQQHGVRVELK
jgi:hypothetical protein